MSIGELRHRMTFQRCTSNINENGFEAKGFEDFKTVWAKATNLYGKEYFEAAVMQKEKTVKFIIRTISGIDETMRILFKGKTYNIIFIDNIKYENKYIEIKAMEVDADG